MTAALGESLAAALAAAPGDRIVYDLTGIERRYDALCRELPDVRVRFAMKACPLHEVLALLARKGAGVDAASPGEVAQALRAGVPTGRMHYGNTVKSDRNIADAHRLGIRTFATDSLQDVAALAVHAPRRPRLLPGGDRRGGRRVGTEPQVRMPARRRRTGHGTGPGPGAGAGRTVRARRLPADDGRGVAHGP